MTASEMLVHEAEAQWIIRSILMLSARSESPNWAPRIKGKRFRRGLKYQNEEAYSLQGYSRTVLPQ